jgi:starch synthase
MLTRGIRAADRVNTVSPTYATEVTTAGAGCGLEDVLRTKGVSGILNGIDTDAWKPAWNTDNWRAGKARARNALLTGFELGWQPGDIVLGCIARLTHQKGIDLLIDAVENLDRFRLAVLGTGSSELEDRLRTLERNNRGRISVRIAFDERLAKLVNDGADAFVMPSRFEPCGLAQLHAMRCGTVPIVRAVGGLADTVSNRVGFSFETASAQALADAIKRAAKVYRTDPAAWAAKVVAGMERDSSWATAAQAYLDLYEEILDADPRAVEC